MMGVNGVDVQLVQVNFNFIFILKNCDRFRKPIDYPEVL